MENQDYRILVVDDEQRVRQAVDRILSPQGYTLNEAGDGAAGLKAIAADPPDLVLVDLMMPVMDGMEFLAEARKLYPDLIFVVITGYATLEKAVEAMKQGADDFLAKPFKPRELKLVVDRALKRVRTLKDMAIEKSRTRALINAMNNGVLVADPSGEVALVNPALRRQLGLGDAPLLGRPLDEALPCPEVVESLKSVLAAGGVPMEPVSCHVVIGPPEDALHLQATCQPFLDGRGGLKGAVAVFDDVTALARLDQLKSEYVSTVAHEIASPLSAVLSQLQVVVKGLAGPLTEKQNDLLSRARERVGGIITLSKELLDLAKIEAGAFGEPVEVDIRPLIVEAVDVMRDRAKDKGQTVELDLPPSLPPVMGIAREFLEVFTNLVSNAVKYTPDGGRVSVSAQAADGGVQVAIADTGYGIAPDDQDKVFQRFYRVKDAQTRLIVGTGLGLPIVKKVVEESGGRIELTSQPGQGSTFTVFLPVA